MPYKEVVPPEPHPQPSGPPSSSGFPVDHATPCTPSSTQYYEEPYEEPPSNPSDQDEYGYGNPAEGGPNGIGNSPHAHSPLSIVPDPHHSTGYLPNANPRQSTGYPLIQMSPGHIMCSIMCPSPIHIILSLLMVLMR